MHTWIYELTKQDTSNKQINPSMHTWIYELTKQIHQQQQKIY